MCKIILCLALSLGTAQAGLSRLAALSMIESADNDSAVGQVGEVSRFQIKPWIWKLYSQSEDYRNPVIARYVAEKHLSSLEQTFRKRARRNPGDFDLYVLWNAGPTYYGRIGFAQARVHPVIRERANRYANLCSAHNLRPETMLVQTPATNRPARSNPDLAQAAPKPAPASRASEALLPTVPMVTPTSLQHPMFSLLPLASQPEADSGRKQGIFAVGGIPGN